MANRELWTETKQYLLWNQPLNDVIRQLELLQFTDERGYIPCFACPGLGPDKIVWSAEDCLPVNESRIGRCTILRP